MLLQDRLPEHPTSLDDQSGIRRDDAALVEDRTPVPHEDHAGHAEHVLVGRHDGEQTSGHDEALKAALAEEARHQVGSVRLCLGHIDLCPPWLLQHSACCSSTASEPSGVV